MIIITGTITASEQTIDELLQHSLEHVGRSRQEPGCLSHGVFRDVENPLRLVFVEQWADLDAVQAHFGVPASIEFGRTAAALGAERPTLDLYDATVIAPPGRG